MKKLIGELLDTADALRSEGLKSAPTKILEAADALNVAYALLYEAVDRYPVEEDTKLWTSRVRAWLKENENA